VVSLLTYAMGDYQMIWLFHGQQADHAITP